MIAPAFALDQVKQRYEEIKTDDTFSGLRRLRFEKNGFRVTTTFVADRVGAIYFAKLPTQKFRASDQLSQTDKNQGD